MKYAAPSRFAVPALFVPLRFLLALFLSALVILLLGFSSQASYGQTSFSTFGQSHRDFRPNLFRDASPGYLRSNVSWSNQPTLSSYYRSVVSGSGTTYSGSSATRLYSNVYSGSGLDSAGYLYSTNGSQRHTHVIPGVVQTPRYIYPGNFDPFTRRTRSAIYQSSPRP